MLSEDPPQTDPLCPHPEPNREPIYQVDSNTELKVPARTSPGHRRGLGPWRSSQPHGAGHYGAPKKNKVRKA